MDTTIKGQKRISVIRKTMVILESLLVKGGRSITEISLVTCMPKPTVYTLLKTMEDEEMIYQDLLTKKYRLGFALTRLGRFASEENNLRDLALPIMLDIREKSGESVHLNIISGDERVCIESLDSKFELKVISKVGERSKLYCGASARVMLAHLPTEEIERILGSSQEFHLNLDNRFLTRDELLKDLQLIREKGFATSSGERIEGVSAITVPIKNHQGKLVAGLSVSVPDARFKADRVSFLIEIAKEGARRISEAL